MFSEFRTFGLTYLHFSSRLPSTLSSLFFVRIETKIRMVGKYFCALEKNVSCVYSANEYENTTYLAKLHTN